MSCPAGASVVRKVFQLSGMHYPTQDPFEFFAFHDDVFPGGDGKTGAVGDRALLRGRNIGSDFSMKDGFCMYHGETVPGFPQHPHYGFETVSIVSKGLVDHSDSLGSGGRFGNGDVQWMTAGAGVQHAEMFPLLSTKSNPMEFMQIWVNLPKKSKMAPPHYAMLWREDLQTLRAAEQAKGGPDTLTIADPALIAPGSALSPPPHSWASDPANHFVVRKIFLKRGEAYTLPALAAGTKAPQDVSRSLYFLSGGQLTVDGREHQARTGFELDPTRDAAVTHSGAETSVLLLLQGRRIQEPKMQQGPFFGSTREDLTEAMQRYRKTQFGGWPWKSDQPLYPLSEKRFSVYTDGRREDRGD